MNDIIKNYYNIKECKKFSINSKYKNNNRINDIYNEIVNDLHIENKNNSWYKLNPFIYLQFGNINKKTSTYPIQYKNNYYNYYFNKNIRTPFDTSFSKVLYPTRLRWLVQSRINYSNILIKPKNIFYVNLGYSKELTNKFKQNYISDKIYPELKCYIKDLLLSQNIKINQWDYTIFDSYKNYNDNMSYNNLDINKTKYKDDYLCVNFTTPFVNNKIVSIIQNDYLVKMDLLYCNNIIRKRDSNQNIKRKIIYIIYIGLQVLVEGGSLVIQLDYNLYKTDNKYLTDILNILNIYFDDVNYFINNLERSYLNGSILIIANQFNNNDKINIIGDYIKSKYKLDLSKHYSKYNKDIINSIGHVFDYINKMVKLLNQVSIYNKTLSNKDKTKLYDILDKPRYKITKDIIKKYNILPPIDIKYHTSLLSHIRENKPTNILLYGNIFKDIKDTIKIANDYNFKKNNIYEFDSILDKNIRFDFVYINFNCKDNGKFILSYIMKILNPDAYILFKTECKYLKNYKQLKKNKIFKIDNYKYLLYNLKPIEDSLNSSDYLSM